MPTPGSIEFDEDERKLVEGFLEIIPIELHDIIDCWEPLLVFFLYFALAAVPMGQALRSQEC